MKKPLTAKDVENVGLHLFEIVEEGIERDQPVRPTELMARAINAAGLA